VKLAAAVADAGGIGSFGFAYTTPAIVASTLAEAKKLSTGHLNANFFAMGPVAVPTREAQEKAIKALQELPHGVAGAGTYAVKDSAPAGFDLHEQLEGVWANPPTFLSFHFGVPPLDIVKKAQGMGICVLACATNVEEGRAIQEGGLDGVIAQGSEAGGHRHTRTHTQTHIHTLSLPERYI
jgi:nitronate monooxygenase